MPDSATGARALPIYQTTSYVFNDTAHAANLFALKEFGNIYTRIMNPTQDAVEQRIAALEGGVGALLVSSGQAATTIGLLNIAEAGDHIVSSAALYGGTVNLLKFTFKKLGIDVTFVDDQADLEAWRAAVRPNTKAFFAETIANPKAEVLDIEGVAGGRPRGRGAARRRQHDRDAVPHPPARVGRRRRHPLGDEVPRRPRHVDRRRHRRRRHLRLRQGPGEATRTTTRRRRATTGWSSPVTSASAERSAPTSPTSSRRGCSCCATSARRSRRSTPSSSRRASRRSACGWSGTSRTPGRSPTYLEAHPQVESVRWASLDSSPSKALADKYAPQGAGAVLAFEIVGGLEAGQRFVEGLSLHSHVANIGDVRSLAIHPASTTHSQGGDEDRLAAGVTPGLVRLAVGIESIQDILADLDAGFARGRWARRR